MEEKINELISLSYKNRFSIYYKSNLYLQHKETDEVMVGAITKMIDFLNDQSRSSK